MADVKFDYDAKIDSLFLYDLRKKADTSAIIGDIVLDFSKNSVVGLEMLHASQLIADCMEGYSAFQIKNILKNMNLCEIQFFKRRNRAHMKLIIQSQEGKELRPILNFVNTAETSQILSQAISS